MRGLWGDGRDRTGRSSSGEAKHFGYPFFAFRYFLQRRNDSSERRRRRRLKNVAPTARVDYGKRTVARSFRPLLLSLILSLSKSTSKNQ